LTKRWGSQSLLCHGTLFVRHHRGHCRAGTLLAGR
jgi:hypothetical protein